MYKAKTSPNELLREFEQLDRISGSLVPSEKAPAEDLPLELRRHLLEERTPTIQPPSSRFGQMQSITIKGPFTPLKSSLYELTSSSTGEVRIEAGLVNHVLLENEPNDMSEKYLVAASVYQKNVDLAPVTVCQTTLMPNIRSFGPLMAAIFAPNIKLLRNKDNTYYIKMISGLGCDANNVLLSSQTTMTFDLDVELKNADIETVII